MTRSQAPPKNRPVRKKAPKKTVDPVLSPVPEVFSGKNFPIVGIGASAGGLTAIEAFLSSMPFVTEKGIALVFVQHLSPNHKSMLTELVKRYTRMQVQEVEDGMEVQPNRAYIIPPNRDMALLGGKLQLFEPSAARAARLPIDFFFRSLAADQHERAICVVLSGTGSDGTLGVRAVKGEGGMAMAQSLESSQYDGMPRSAIATGLVDYVMEPAQMPAQLITYVNQIFASAQRLDSTIPGQKQDTLAKVCVLLRAKTGHDFSRYKQNTLSRRMHRRMALREIAEASDYLRFLQHDSIEVDALFRDLLIGVTSFFRDPIAFAVLEQLAIPRLFQGLLPGDTVRLWVCACSTGEEAYSIAILIQEYLREIQQVFKIQVFATDIDRHAIEQARRGLFPPSIASDVTPERLERFFTRNADGFYQIQKVIRDSILFSEQDLLKDPPFSKLGLLSCRNVLIYLKPDVQKHLMRLFHYALKPGGMLFLGSSETAGEPGGLFEPLDRNAKIFVGRSLKGAERAALPGIAMPAPDRTGALRPADPAQSAKRTLREIADQAALLHFAKAGVLIDAHGDVLYFHGQTGNFLEPTPGEAGYNVLAMARKGLRTDLVTALHRAVTNKEVVHVNALDMKVGDRPFTAEFTILPAGSISSKRSDELFLVLFNEEKSPAVPLPSDHVFAGREGGADLKKRISDLEEKLLSKDEYIQSILEEMETSGEELKSSNEEMQSINEEMQSANEELETSKEELQSVNEELATVNAELQQKVADLSRANNDMNNLLAGTGVGTLFVDNQLHILRFTPSIKQIINVIQTDIGRPLSDIVSNLAGYDGLLADVEKSLDTLEPLQREVQTKAGAWYLLGIRPYRTLDHVIEGAVLTFLEVTERKLAEEKLREAERFRQAAEIANVGVVFAKTDGFITFANNSFLTLCGFAEGDLALGKFNWETITPPEWASNSTPAEVTAGGQPALYEMELIRKDGTRRRALITAHRLSEDEVVRYVLDIGQTKAAKG